VARINLECVYGVGPVGAPCRLPTRAGRGRVVAEVLLGPLEPDPELDLLTKADDRAGAR
jgi:hypothetical protein